jgi:uncharacterized integral membrane protein
MRYVTGVLAVLLLAAVVAFSVQNRDDTSVAFLTWTLTVPKVFLILGTFVLGMLSAGGLVALVKRAF